jgi:hypothetical protein
MKYIVRNIKTGRKMKDAITGKTIIYGTLEEAQKSAVDAYRYEYLSKGRAGRRAVEEVAA